MTSLAISFCGSMLAGTGSPPAGDTGKHIARIAAGAVGDLKQGIAAGSSAAFNDLHALAHEEGVSVNANATFALAQRFLLSLPHNLPSPALALDDDGEIALDWRGGTDRVMTMTLRADGRLTYACRLAPLRRRHGTDLYNDEVPPEVMRCIQQVAGTS